MYAAVPAAPALGGKPKRTMATFLLHTSARRRLASFSILAPSFSIRSWHGAMGFPTTAADLSLPIELSPCLPAKTVGLVAPSSSGSAMSIVVSIGPRPCELRSHCSSVWNSSGCAAI